MPKRPLVAPARQLRRTQTDAELRLWRHLRNRQLGGFKFRRQFPIAGCVVDLICLERGLVIEVDGGQHCESTSDEWRTTLLEAVGLRVVRFWNNEVLANCDGVLDAILAELTTPLTPALSPLGRG